MAWFGGKKNEKPQELVKRCKDAVLSLDGKVSNPKAAEKALEDISKSLDAMRVTLHDEMQTNPEAAVALANEIFSADLLLPLLVHLSKYDFEAKKDTVTIFNNLLKRQVGSRSPTVEYIARNPALLETLCIGYESPDAALSCGAMLREGARHEPLVRAILQSPVFWKFFKYIELPNFDLASDAFSSLKEVLTKHKAPVAEFLEKYYDQFFQEYATLLNSQNYVTKRQSLKLLGELLLDRANFNVMTKYISEQSNLKLLMVMLKDKSRSIQFEAFHVFKVFVANPNKPAPILHILCKNKEKLISFLSNFHNDKEDDQFTDEKAFLIKQIQALPNP